MKCYGLGLGLDTFRIVSLGENFRRLDPISVMNTYSRCVVIIYRSSNRSWDCAAISTLVKPNVADHLHWMSTLVHCSSCTHALSFKWPFSPPPVDPLLLLAQLPLVKLGTGSVSVHHCCICWQACLCLTPQCQHLRWVMAWSIPNDPPFHAGQASDCFCWTMMALWWIRQLSTTSPMLKC